MKPKSGPKYFKLTLDINKISKALKVPEKEVLVCFRDGRVASRFSEYWASSLFQFAKVVNTNQPGYDGLLNNPLLGELTVGTRCLTKSGIKFQQSKYIGSGRTCSKTDLITSIDKEDFLITVDITNFPIVYMIPVHKDILLKLVKEGKLTPSGFTKKNFYKYIVGVQREDILWVEVSNISTNSKVVQ